MSKPSAFQAVACSPEQFDLETGLPAKLSSAFLLGVMRPRTPAPVGFIMDRDTSLIGLPGRICEQTTPGAIGDQKGRRLISVLCHLFGSIAKDAFSG